MRGFKKKASEIDIKLEKLRLIFLTRLAQKGQDIHERLIEISQHGPLPELRDAIARNAHQTAGVAASFGYRELGALAFKVEAAWTMEFSTETLDRANSMTESYLDMVEATLDP
jgi:chemotaxis protein histidine kinase CheA